MNLDDLNPAVLAQLNRPHMGTRDPDPRVEEALRARLDALRIEVDARKPRDPREAAREELHAEIARMKAGPEGETK